MKDNYEIFYENSINSFKSVEWSRCNINGNIFLSYNFLDLLEHSKSINANSGWEPIYFGLKKNDQLVAVIPSFIKDHSQGEFVFDHSWAQAYQRLGMRYYPKLLIASPFTPVTGKRILTNLSNDLLVKEKLIKYIKEFCLKRNISSIHVNFFDPSELSFYESKDFLIRYGEQFHFINNRYKTFNDFLSSLSYKNRKKIIKERNYLSDLGIKVEIVRSKSLTKELCEKMYKFYISTIDKKWSYNYLSKDFFLKLPNYLKEESILILARYNNNIIAGALNFLSENVLYGRYWGSNMNIKYLHFEVCYYKAIELAIDNNYLKVEAGAQGAHKIKRGYSPQLTYSGHYIFNPELREAIKNFVREEKKLVLEEINLIKNKFSPFKSS